MTRFTHRAGYVLALCLALVAATVRADVNLPSIFSDNMVLQQGKPIPVHGTAAPSEKIIVELCGQRKETTADAAGNWQVLLEPLARLSEPTNMRVTGTNTVTIENVVIGDVWLASGQSNMEMRVSGVNNAAEEIKVANYPGIRFFMVSRDMAPPREDTAGKWLSVPRKP